MREVGRMIKSVVKNALTFVDKYWTITGESSKQFVKFVNTSIVEIVTQVGLKTFPLLA